MKFSIVIASYKRIKQLRCLLYSLVCQTYDNFEVITLHECQDDEFDELTLEFTKDKRFIFYTDQIRYCDFGHTMRNKGYHFSSGDVIVFTNDDNYYTPNFLSELKLALDSNPGSDFVYYDMVHSHNNKLNHNGKDYGLFIPKLGHSLIDVGQFAIRKETAKGHLFNSKPDADGDYIEEIKHKIKPVYINKILYVHN